MAVVATKPPLIFTDKSLLRPLMDALAQEMDIPQVPNATAREAQRLVSIDLANNGINPRSRPFNDDLESMRQGR